MNFLLCSWIVLSEQGYCQIFEGCSNRSVRFYELFYRTEGLKSGMRHPDGLLWIHFPSEEHRVPLVDVAPSLLGLYSVPAACYMRCESLFRCAAVRLQDSFGANAGGQAETI